VPIIHIGHSPASIALPDCRASSHRRTEGGGAPDRIHQAQLIALRPADYGCLLMNFNTEQLEVGAAVWC
jgi:hypothetical protein